MVGEPEYCETLTRTVSAAADARYAPDGSIICDSRARLVRHESEMPDCLVNSLPWRLSRRYASHHRKRPRSQHVRTAWTAGSLGGKCSRWMRCALRRCFVMTLNFWKRSLPTNILMSKALVALETNPNSSQVVGSNARFFRPSSSTKTRRRFTATSRLSLDVITTRTKQAVDLRW